MPREIVVCQIGQCGIQLGTRFWEVALEEHRQFNTTGVYDEPLSSFFRNVPPTAAAGAAAGAAGTAAGAKAKSALGKSAHLSGLMSHELGAAKGVACETGVPIGGLKARAVCVDMENGVLNAMMRSPLGALYDAPNFVSDVSGAGNNWAHGHLVYAHGTGTRFWRA